MSKINKNNIIIPLICALVIVIINNLKIDFYIKSITVPFSLILISNLFLIKNNVNKKAYYLVIPIGLILVSNLFIKIDEANKILNVFVLIFLLSEFFYLLVNKKYSISFYKKISILEIFPKRVFSNLKYIKQSIKKENNQKIANIVTGILLGIVIARILLFLLTNADMYFKIFTEKITNLFNFNISNIILFLVSFILIFSISINVLKLNEAKVKETKNKNIDDIIIIIVLAIMNFVFLLFIISEISKLTNNFLHIPKLYTYAEYAREGFFQLLFVTIINYIVSFFIIYNTKSTNNKIVKNLLLGLIIFSIVLIFNSYYRMYLYIDKFGFTVLRMQVILFLLMEIILFCLIIKKILSKLNKDALYFLIVTTVFYIINLYICNDIVIKLINKII